MRFFHNYAIDLSISYLYNKIDSLSIEDMRISKTKGRMELLWIIK